MIRPPVTGAAMVHGGQLEAARRQFPEAPLPLIDLSTGINPIAYPLPALPAACFTRLPESEAVLYLERIAAEAYGAADPATVAAAPGTQILIDLLPRLLALPSVAVLGPTYAEHAAAWARTGSAVSDITSLADLGDERALVVCNPNNPDGRIIAPAVLHALADRLASRGGYLVVDEAFADLITPDISLASALPHPAIVVLRSFGKTYGLAGVRLGFAIASCPLTTIIRAALGPWAVSGPAITIGSTALADRNWLTQTRQRLDHEVRMLDAHLGRAGLPVIGGTSLFRLAAAPTAPEWYARLGHAGIIIRRFETAPEWLRFGIPGTATAWSRLNLALKG